MRLGAPGDAAVTVIDRREGAARTYRFEAGAADLSERVAAVAGGRGGMRAKVLLDPAACFIRCLDVPSAALPRMRALLAEELEAATPFRAAGVYSDWFVEGEDVAARVLRVRHVVIKKARLDPVLDALAAAGLPVGPVAVGRAEDQTLPVDLLSHGHRALPGVAGKGDSPCGSGRGCSSRSPSGAGGRSRTRRSPPSTRDSPPPATPSRAWRRRSRRVSRPSSPPAPRRSPAPGTPWPPPCRTEPRR